MPHDAARVLAEGIWAPPGSGLTVVAGPATGLRLRVLAPRGRPRLILSPGPGAVRALRAGNGLRARRDRLRRLGVGMAATVTRETRTLTVVQRDPHAPRVTRDIMTAANLPAERFLVTVRPGDDHYKPTLTLLDRTGHATGYAKLGWTAGTAAGVHREAQLLADPPVSPRLTVPTLLAAGDHAGRPWFVTAPLPDEARRHGEALPDLALLADLCGPVSVADPHVPTGHWDSASGARADLLAASRARLTRAWRHGVAVGRAHGDWVPWNTARLGPRTFAWDWEHHRANVPVGFDALHWRVMTLHTCRGLGWQTAYTRLLANDPSLAPLALFHATELLHRSDALRTPAGREPFPIDDVVAGLLAVTTEESDR